MATSIDNPFAIARNRSEKAGQVLADALINRAQGERPVTLLGYSLGSRVVYSCLKSLAERKAFGLIENVVFIGSPVPSNGSNWRVMRSVVSGKIFNVYSENDYILAFLYRATSLQFGVAGLQKIGDAEGIENMDLSKEVSGHLRYPELIGKILKRTGIEHVLVDNTEIENDNTEIQLLDAENPDTKRETEARTSHQADLLDLMDAPIGVSELDGMNEITRSMAGMDMSPQPLNISQGFNETHSFRPEGSRSMSDPTMQLHHAFPPPLQSRSTDTDILSITQTLNNIHVSDPPSYTRDPIPTSKSNQYDSDSDDGGIQMIDNDSDGLEYVPSVPIAEDWEPEPRDAGKVPAFEEQKSLGSFPRTNRSESQEQRSRREVESRSDDSASGSKGKARATAAQYGLN